ncbi:hypothetical protein JMJ77_0013620, partial [Colletotrichum scovillei]
MAPIRAWIGRDMVVGMGQSWDQRWVTGGRVGNIAAERQTQHKQQHGSMGAVRHPAPDELSVIPVCAKA